MDRLVRSIGFDNATKSVNRSEFQRNFRNWCSILYLLHYAPKLERFDDYFSDRMKHSKFNILPRKARGLNYNFGKTIRVSQLLVSIIIPFNESTRYALTFLRQTRRCSYQRHDFSSLQSMLSYKWFIETCDGKWNASLPLRRKQYRYMY